MARAITLHERVDQSRNIPAIVSGVANARFRSDLAEYREILARLYQGIHDVTGGAVIVDSSKHPAMAFVLRGIDGVDMTCAHVLRDPRGVAFSHSKHIDLEPGDDVRTQVPRSKPAKVARRWVTVNGAFDLLKLTGVPSVTIRYEDLVRSTHSQLGRIAKLNDTPFDRASIDPSRVPTGAHIFAGGRIRLGQTELAIRLDEAWRTELPPDICQMVGRRTLLARARYGYLGP